MTTTTTIIAAAILIALLAASIIINVALVIERRATRADYDYMTAQGAALEKRLELQQHDNDVKQAKIDGYIIVNRQLRGDLKSLKSALKLANKDRYQQWQARHQENNEED